MGFHKASNRYENGVAYVVADASWLALPPVPGVVTELPL